MEGKKAIVKTMLGLGVPESAIRPDDRFISALVTMHGDTWVCFLRDGALVVIGDDIDWEAIEPSTILNAQEQAWLAALQVR